MSATADEAGSLIWASGVDDGAYFCQVMDPGDSVSGSHGVLTVRRASDNEIILTEDVTLAYGAMFGPDVDDVAPWQARCLEVIDEDIAKAKP